MRREMCIQGINVGDLYSLNKHRIPHNEFVHLCPTICYYSKSILSQLSELETLLLYTHTPLAYIYEFWHFALPQLLGKESITEGCLESSPSNPKFSNQPLILPLLISIFSHIIELVGGQFRLFLKRHTNSIQNLEHFINENL